MLKAFEFCTPTTGTKVPSAPEWLHEIKYNGYRLRVERSGDRAQLITRGGHDWTNRFPWIAEGALKNRQQRVQASRWAISRWSAEALEKVNNPKLPAFNRVLDSFR